MTLKNKIKIKSMKKRLITTLETLVELKERRDMLTVNEQEAIEETLQIIKDLYGIAVFETTPTGIRGKRFMEQLKKIERM